jgi:hypothetical protein
VSSVVETTGLKSGREDDGEEKEIPSRPTQSCFVTVLFWLQQHQVNPGKDCGEITSTWAAGIPSLWCYSENAPQEYV